MDNQKERKKKEDAWFHENEKELLAKLRAEREARMKERHKESEHKHREELKKAHWMCCPKCGHGMETKDYTGIEVDVCTFCEGIFFDRGELEDFLNKKYEARRSFFFELLGLS
jgi:rubrerythrin